MNNKKRILVTGGGKGIGEKVIRLLVSKGYEMHFTYCRSKKSAEKLCSEFPNKVFAHYLNMADPDSINTGGFSEISDWYGIIFNAGVGSASVNNYANSPDTSEDQLDEAMLKINALGPLSLYRRLKPNLIKNNHAKIIFISSVGGGIAAFPGFRYSDGMSKAALSYLARQIATENTDSGIDVFTLCPGATETSMFEASTLNKLSPSERAHFVQKLPKGRLIQPEEIAHWIAKLLEPESTVLHGCIIDASAGLGIRPSHMD
ncbi:MULTISPECIES: SDR family NAD(P)-dependent oxidoreductase [Pseudomonas]|uniref:NAD(P)-dependent oxidoreductase n=1 Tax=Pseudomonas protegens TaxID=380021 RepID=A0A9Q6IDN1_9PSED|nr:MULTISPECIES: SDR family oxidoreductase [Pseudomonas]MBS7557778.1 SDR family oxidoreductase [Pseudomonas sp. RC4D1]MCY7258608.1 SDR family oxidoreductase [Pseudomonas protegens]MDC7813130.1 SDR family oxidoreductase [Pseudomonas sp. BLCC-B112]MDP9501475.1 SDR family oxidoreductase [Pseudomonas protegens]PYC31922.1 NAD(P)-dependent oxidoreductase [Pseudomonas protegens]